jgi:hypothetical protein
MCLSCCYRNEGASTGGVGHSAAGMNDYKYSRLGFEETRYFEN